MKIYKVEWTKWNNSIKSVTVAANSASAAVNDAKRHIKKNEYESDPNITKVEMVMTIDVYYRT